jgi:hypothetical protein
MLPRRSVGRVTFGPITFYQFMPLREAFPAMERVVMMHIGGTIGQERSQHALVMKVQSG